MKPSTVQFEGNIVRLPRAGDYGLQAIFFLAMKATDGEASADEIARELKLPSSFLKKILQRLSATGILRSTKGYDGGFSLSRPAERLSMLEVIEAIDGPIRLNVCLHGPGSCPRQATCAMHPVWREAQGALRNVLSAWTFDRLGQLTHTLEASCPAAEGK